MRMNELWQRIDAVIDTFVNQENGDFEKSFILWKLPILQITTNTILRGSKTIISPPSAASAATLKNALQQELSKEELLIYDPGNGGRRPYKLNIKIIGCPENAGQLVFKKSHIPVTTHELSVEKVLSLINNIEYREIKLIRRQQNMDLSTAEKKIDEIKEQYDEFTAAVKSKLKERKKYCVSYIKPFAMSYRVTYNDDISHGRKQTPVGDVLIVINGTEIVDDQRMTKPRTDIVATKYKKKHIISGRGISIFNDWKKPTEK